MKKKKKLILIFTICFLIPIFYFARNAQADTEKEVIRVGYFNLDGYQEVDKNGRCGYGYEYLQEIAQYGGWEYEFIDAPWEECLEMLDKGEIDLLTCAAYSDSRAKKYEYSKSSIGNCFIVMSVRSDNNKYYYCDFESFNGMTVGLLKSSNINKIFDEYCRKNNFSVNKKYFADSSQLKDALVNGEIDAIVNTSMRSFADEKVIARFDLGYSYAISQKGNKELINKFDDAVMQIQMINPQYMSELYEKYYINNYKEDISFTREEAEFIKENPVIKVVATPNRCPLSYFENGTYKGIVSDIMNIIQDDIGITFEYIEVKSYEEALELVKNNKADAICDVFKDYNWATKNNLSLTLPYHKLNYSAVTKKGKAPGDLRVAVSGNLYFNKTYVLMNHDEDHITVYNNEQECIDAVKAGKQDIAYINTYVAENILSNGYYNTLMSNIVEGFSHSISMGVNKSGNILLYKILDKGIGNLDKSEIESIVERNTMFQKYKVTWKTYIYHNPIQAVIILIAVLILIIVVFLILLNMRRKYMRKIYNLAYIDTVTGVWNRNGFEEEAEKFIKESKSSNFVVISIDVNRFAVINDNYGRDEGDRILKFMSEIIKESINETGIISRIRADNFIILLSYHEDMNITQNIEKIIERLKVYVYNGQNIKLQLSCGVYIMNDKNENIHTCIDMAEIARKEAKFKSEHIVFFNENMEEALYKEKGIEDSMEHALENGEFKIYYQPKVDMRDKKIIGAEALVRWISPEKGFMNPGDFIPLFEKNGFIVDMDFYVLEEVCKVIKSWIDEGNQVFSISVNQSRVHLTQKDYVKRLKELKEKYNIPDNIIELELTETVFMDTRNISGFINEIKKLGFLISVDDFGSGYSSLNMLNKIPIDVLKIDKDFLAESKTSERSKVIICKVVQMALELNMNVICEGVERNEQAEFLMESGCNYAQGFLYSKPISEKDFLEKIAL